MQKIHNRIRFYIFVKNFPIKIMVPIKGIKKSAVKIILEKKVTVIFIILIFCRYFG